MWKYTVPLVPGHEEIIDIPIGAEVKFAMVDLKTGILCMWFEVNRDAKLVNRCFTPFATGEDIPDDYIYQFSWQDVPFIWHLYESPL